MTLTMQTGYERAYDHEVEMGEPGCAPRANLPCWNSPVTGSKLAMLVASYAAGLGGRLTGREIEITRLLLSGLSAKEIAQHIDISPDTVRTHMRNVYLKLEVSSQARLCARFFEYMVGMEAVR